MNCELIDQHLIDYLYGELSPEKTKEFRSHLETCSECSQKAASLGGLRNLASNLKDPEPSGIAVNKIIACAREEAETKRSLWSFGWLKIMSAICMTAIVGGLVAFQLRSGLVTKDELAAPPVHTARTETVRPQPAENNASETTSPVAEKTDAPTGEKALTPVFRGRAARDVQPVLREREPGAGTREQTKIVLRARPLNPNQAEDIRDGGIHEDFERVYGHLSNGLRIDDSAPFTIPEDMNWVRDIEEALNSKLSAPLETHDMERLLEGRKSLNEGDYEPASEAFQKIIVQIPQGHKYRTRVLLWLAKSYEGRGYNAIAVKAYQALADESPEYRDMALAKIEELKAE